MPQDFDPERPARKPGDSTLKIVLIVFGSLAGVAVLTCCGVGAGGYFWFKKNFGQVALTAPADIRKLTAEMTDIDILPEFIPQVGTSLLGFKTVTYQWCPGGNCPSAVDGLGQLQLSSIGLEHEKSPNPDGSSPAVDPQFSDDVLAQEWKSFTKSTHVLQIRNQACTFHVIEGEQRVVQFEEDESPAAMSDSTNGEEAHAEPASTDDQAETASPDARPGLKLVRIVGKFPGKQAECTLEIRLAPKDYDAGKILEMLKSIR